MPVVRSRSRCSAPAGVKTAPSRAMPRSLPASMALAATLLGLFSLSSGVAGSGLPVWTQVAVTGPPADPGNEGPMVYDSARHKMVLFAGSHTLPNDIWEFNGTAWTKAASGGPSPRVQPAMAYDSARGKTLLFGGYTYIASSQSWVYHSDTWEWDGAAWTQLAAAGPAAYGDIAMCYDSVRGKAVLCDAATGDGTQSGTWEWTGAAWTPVVSAAPSGIATLALAFDSARGVSVLFAGGGIWERGSGEWAPVAASGPGPGFRNNAAMAFDSARGRTVLYGGSSSNHGFPFWLADTWEWDGANWRQAPVAAAPPARAQASMAFDSANQKVVLFGGAGNFLSYADTWTYAGPLPFTMADAVSALKLAAGLVQATADDLRLFDVVDAEGVTRRINVADAAYIARKAAGL